MSPEAARVFCVEDDPDSFEVRKEFLERTGHKVVLTADCRKEVTEKIPLIRDAGVQVAIVDGNLSEDDSSGDDGEAVAIEIKKAAPEVVVIGNATGKPIVSADKNCLKSEDVRKLVETITNA